MEDRCEGCPVIEDCEIFYSRAKCVCALSCFDLCNNPCPKCLLNQKNISKKLKYRIEQIYSGEFRDCVLED